MLHGKQAIYHVIQDMLLLLAFLRQSCLYPLQYLIENCIEIEIYSHCFVVSKLKNSVLWLHLYSRVLMVLHGLTISDCFVGF